MSWADCLVVVVVGVVLALAWHLKPRDRSDEFKDDADGGH